MIPSADKAKIIVGRAVLMYWINDKLTCEKSGRFLDRRTTVVFEINYTSGNSSAVVVHADYADDVAARVEQTRAHPSVSAVRIYDGRELYKRTRKPKVAAS